jgi:cytochrome c-type biogenesis protein CcmH/NrfF
MDWPTIEWYLWSLPLTLLVGLAVVWRKDEKKRRAAAIGRAHGEAGQSGDVEAILHGDLGEILRRQMPGAADTDPP